jgi:hypothetical protein
MSNIVPFNDMQQMAEVAAGSKMFGFKNTQEAMAIMLLCQAENLHPAVAMRDFHVIQGRPALKADAMLARFQNAGGKVQWDVYTDAEVTGTFSHPSGGSLKLTWTFAQASKIGLTGKDNWKNYPRAMLRARCISEGIRTVYPGCVVGTYTAEEIEEIPKAKDMGMVEEVVAAVEEVQTVPDGAFKLYVPNSDEPYAAFHTEQEWLDAYNDMADRIKTSVKMDALQKAVKLDGLKACNLDMLDYVTPLERAL